MGRDGAMENLAPVLFLLLRLVSVCSSHARSSDPPRYDTAYACEGKVLKIECREGEIIQLIRANYGRFSITICNDHGNTEWSVNCMSPKSLRVLHSKCSLQHNCSIPASTNMFGDPCPGTLKYLEAHYRCVPATTTPTTTRPSPLWLITSQPSVWSTTKLATLRPPAHSNRASGNNSGVAPSTNSKQQGGSTAPVIISEEPVSVTAVANGIVTIVPKRQNFAESEDSSLLFTMPTVAPAPAWKTATMTTSSSSSSPSSSSSSSTSSSASSSTSLPSGISGGVEKLDFDGNAVSATPASSWRPNGEILHYCTPTSIRNLYWNWTKVGEVDVQPCPGGATGVARWRCSLHGNGASWFGSSPDLSQCRSVWLTTLDARIDDGDALVNIADDLAQVTSSNSLYGGDMIMATSIVKRMTERLSKNIQTFPDPSQKEAIVTELLQAVVRTTSNVIDDTQMAGWSDLSHEEQMRVATALLIGLEENAFLLADNVFREKTIVQTVKNILLSVRVIRTQDLESECFPSGYERKEQDLNTANLGDGDLLVVPRDAMADNSEGGFVRIVFAAFHRLEEILVPIDADISNGTTRIVNSRIISASLGKGRHIQFTQWVHITLKHLHVENVSNPSCVFWDYTTSGWSEEGCLVEATNRTHTICKCNHLTNFAILMDVHAIYLPPSHQLALQIITYIGCIVSIVCLLLSVITFHLFRGLKSDRNTIHKNLCMCLLVAEVLFVVGISQTDKPIMCGVVAGLLHFVFLCAFAWMFLEGFQLYVMLVEVFEAEKSRVRWYYLFAYGAPLLIVCVSCVVDPLSYGTDKYCWLRADNFFIFSFVGPVIAVIIANLVFLSMAIYLMCRHSATTVSIKSKEHSRLASARAWLRGAIVLVFLLGLTWTFGLLYLNEGSVVMAYIFTVLNSLQGLFIFLFHCLQNDKVRKEYRKCSAWLPQCFHCSYDGSTQDGKDGRTSVCVGSASVPAHSHPHNRSDTSTLAANHPHARSDASSLASSPHVPNGHNKMYFKSGARDARGEDDGGGRNVSGSEVHNYPNYTDRSATLGDVRRQAYRHGSDRVLVVELERQNGARAATLHVAKRRRDRYPSDTRRGEGEDPVYEEIRQAASDMSDEEMRRGVVSRQSLRSYGDHSPLIPSPHNPQYPPYPQYPQYPLAHSQNHSHGHSPHGPPQSPRSLHSLHSIHSIHSLHHSPDLFLYTTRGHDR